MTILIRHQYIQVQVSDYLVANLPAAVTAVNAVLDDNDKLRALTTTGQDDFNIGWHPERWGSEAYLSTICDRWTADEPGSLTGFFEVTVRITQRQGNPEIGQIQCGAWLQAMHDLFDMTGGKTGWNLAGVDPDGIKRVAVLDSRKELARAADGSISGFDAVIDFEVHVDLQKLGA